MLTCNKNQSCITVNVQCCAMTLFMGRALKPIPSVADGVTANGLHVQCQTKCWSHHFSRLRQHGFL